MDKVTSIRIDISPNGQYVVSAISQTGDILRWANINGTFDSLDEAVAGIKDTYKNMLPKN